MAEFAYVEDGLVVEVYDALPKNWRNVSGLYMLADDPAALRDLGWFRVDKATVVYDAATQIITGYTYTYIYDRVTETPTVESAPVIEMPLVAQTPTVETVFSVPVAPITVLTPQTTFLEALRKNRNALLRESDWTSLPDVVSIRSEAWSVAWRTYRQQLRDLPATIVEGVDVVWPPLPQA